MTRLIFITAFLLGACVIVWMGIGFIGSNILALTIIAIIACVYLIGFLELTQFRGATSTLISFLSSIPKTQALSSTQLGDKLAKLHPSLLNSVRLRIEGERVPLPAPVLSPYLVGLLVMLGLLGTFAGMVDTLKGAVIALEGTTELQAVRAGLAAPIKGLGLAFGTSVAGVAASAMLGLLSTLSRRDRMLATRILDSNISTSLQGFSLSFNRQETYRALQSQAQAFPEVVDKLELLTIKIEKMGTELGSKLVSDQALFHDSVKENYINLATSVGESLRESLSESGRITSEAVLPLLKDGIQTISDRLSESVSDTHENLTTTTKSQLDAIFMQILKASNDASSSWSAALIEHERSNQNLVKTMDRAFNSFNDAFESKSTSVIENFDKSSQSVLQAQANENEKRLAVWQEAFERIQSQVNKQLEQTATIFSNELKQVTALQKKNIDSSVEHLASVSSLLMDNWASSTEASIGQHERLSERLQLTVTEVVGNAKSTSTAMMSELSKILKTSEELVATRVKTESEWLNSYETRVNNIVTMIRTELKLLVDAEQKRDTNTTDQLAKLETTVASQLADLGNALEAPMTRLIETASETPRAAAEVISHLRREISNNIERDNSLLEERAQIIQSLDSLFLSLEESSIGQRDAVEALVSSSSSMLKDAGSHFTRHIESEVDKLSVISDHFSGSAVEIASLGDAFSHSVELFNQSTSSLIDNLSRIEESLNSSTSKSDEQMAYYIAQAREIIDHSMSSQQGIIDQLSHLGTPSKKKLANAEVV
jgi:hypothetical protein